MKTLRIDSVWNTEYSYDGFNQLTSMDRGTLNGGKTAISGSSRSQAWDYDGLGNWDSQTTNGGSAVTRTHNKQNEITAISGASTPTYDANGNLLTDESAKQFVYDGWNRLVIVKSSGGSTLATYKYDATGRRVRETRGGVTTDLYYTSQWQVIEERVRGTTRLSYVWSPVYVDAMIARDRDSDSNGSLDERLYAVHDANFNVVALLDTSGAVVERFAYDAFGVFSVLTPAWGARGSSSYAWNYLHQGGRWDADGGLYSFRHREYSPTLGRWLQVDPIGIDSGDINWYRARGNRPIVSLDFGGLAETNPHTFDIKGNRLEAWFNPAKSSKANCCDKIGHVQVLKLLRDGKPQKLGDYNKRFKFADKTTTPFFYTVDYIETAKTPVYQEEALGILALGYILSPDEDGSQQIKYAHFRDTPASNGGEDWGWYSNLNPTGSKTIVLEFETFAYCWEGEEKGKFYEGFLWEAHFAAATASKNLGTAKVTKELVDSPSLNFSIAFDLFNKIKGFKP